MSGSENSDGIESAIPRALMIEDTRLNRAYSVQEVAMIASGCTGDSPDARIEDALDLLEAAEKHAFKDKWDKQREWNAKHGHSENIESLKRFTENGKRRYRKAEQICRNAERDKETGKIVRSSLVALAYVESGKGKDSVTANRRYNEWLGFAALNDARSPSYDELNKHLGSLPWDTEKWMSFVERRKASASADSFKKRFESGVKPALIHNEQIAKDLADDFLEWLEKRPKKTPSKIIRSGDDGQIVSPKTRGSKRNEEGKFKPKKSDLADVEEHILPKKRK